MLHDDQSHTETAHDERMRRALIYLSHQLDTALVLAERLSGKSRAWALDAPDGTRWVLKVAHESTCDQVMALAALTAYLRSVGYPTPCMRYAGVLPDGGCVSLQEWLPGQLMRVPGIWTELNQDELRLLLSILARHAQLAPPDSRDWIAHVEAIVVQHQGEWEVVAQSRLLVIQRILGICQQHSAQLGALPWRHDDLVIGDFGPHNMLLDDHGQLAAVLDLEGAGRGARIIDLVGLRYMVEPTLLQQLQCEALAIAHPSVITASGIYWIIHRLYQGMHADAPQLESIAHQMLAHIDLLI